MKPEITIDDFSKLDIVVAKILTAEEVPEANKLVKLTVDVGGTTKTCFAGIKKFFDPSHLIGVNVLFLNNLQPRQMKFGLSEGMVLAASNADHSSLALPSVSSLTDVTGWRLS